MSLDLRPATKFILILGAALGEQGVDFQLYGRKLFLERVPLALVFFTLLLVLIPVIRVRALIVHHLGEFIDRGWYRVRRRLI